MKNVSLLFLDVENETGDMQCKKTRVYACIFCLNYMVKQRKKL